MSALPQPPGNFGNASKKAVHVKWAGKTIALGTFPSAEADEKCARAKALTRAWRSTMRPKPTRDWVMLELERLGVRVVSGRLGRKAGEDDEGDKKAPDSVNPMPSHSVPSHRPFVGNGAAAAYEAARADHYAQKREEQQRRASSLGLGGSASMGGSGMPQMGLSVNPNQHYEMLKLHHMNLLNEIQETTLMMNLYQQQQLQQQQQQLQQQQQASSDNMGGGNDQMSMLLQQQQNSSGGGMDSMFGGGGANNIGMGSSSGNSMMGQQQMMQSSNSVGGIQKDLLKGQQEQNELESRLRKLKEDIAKRQREADELEEAAMKSDNKKPKLEENDESIKQPKLEDNDGGDGSKAAP